MTIQQAIEKAIEGGYDYHEEIPPFSDSLFRILTDFLFWQSLGESLGWDEGLMEDDTYKTAPVTRYMWKHQWHRFVDALAEGKSADDFFKGL